MVLVVPFDWAEAKIELSGVDIKDDMDWCVDIVEEDYEKESIVKRAENVDKNF